MSIYIPRIHVSYDQHYIDTTMQFFMIGVVNRVDFCTIEGIDDYCSAFLHFSYYMDNTYVQEMLSSLEQGDSRKLQISPTEYWILLKNNHPVPDTRLNMHQLAENARLLEERVLSLESVTLKQEQQIFDFRTQVETQKQQMEKLEQMVYQMRAEMVEDYYIRQQQMGTDDKGPMTVDELIQDYDEEDTWCDGHWTEEKEIVDYLQDREAEPWDQEQYQGDKGPMTVEELGIVQDTSFEQEDEYADMPPLIPIEEGMQTVVLW